MLRVNELLKQCDANGNHNGNASGVNRSRPRTLPPTKIAGERSLTGPAAMMTTTAMHTRCRRHLPDDYAPVGLDLRDNSHKADTLEGSRH
jgi:hypothetical protein